MTKTKCGLTGPVGD